MLTDSWHDLRMSASWWTNVSPMIMREGAVNITWQHISATSYRVLTSLLLLLSPFLHPSSKFRCFEK
jgi:hypothetical protein